MSGRFWGEIHGKTGGGSGQYRDDQSLEYLSWVRVSEVRDPYAQLLGTSARGPSDVVHRSGPDWAKCELAYGGASARYPWSSTKTTF